MEKQTNTLSNLSNIHINNCYSVKKCESLKIAGFHLQKKMQNVNDKLFCTVCRLYIFENKTKTQFSVQKL